MDVNDYIRGLSDQDLKKEIRRRNEEVAREAREWMEREYRERQAVRAGARSEFCAAQGITPEQFEAVEDYLDEEANS